MSARSPPRTPSCACGRARSARRTARSSTRSAPDVPCSRPRPARSRRSPATPSHYCNGTTAAIRDGLVALANDGFRAELEQLAGDRGTALSWRASAVLHAALFREVLDA